MSIDPRLFDHYRKELQHVRSVGAEFAKEFPKIAQRLSLEEFDCQDPYVERLLEGFAFLTARVQLKIDAEFPRFTQHLLEMVYPHYLAPMPASAVVQLNANLREGSLAAGVTVPRNTALHSVTGEGDRTPCEFRSAHPVSLWPLELAAAEYINGAAALAAAGIRNQQGARAGLRLQLQITAGVRAAALALDELPVFFAGPDALPFQINEAVFAKSLGFVIKLPGGQEHWCQASQIRRHGYADEQALLPVTDRSFSGYRLVQEYFALPQRFLFANFTGLASALASSPQAQEFEIVILLREAAPKLLNAVDASNFRLFCTPIINLFPRRADRIHLEPGRTEYQIIPDRTRPIDFEVHSVTGAEGYGSDTSPMQQFRPFYSSTQTTWHESGGAFYTLRREPRMLSSRERARGARASYHGSEVFVALVDSTQAPYDNKLRQLGLQLLCTNRDLPLQMPIGRADTDFRLDSGAPVESVRCIAGPQRPVASFAHGDVAWRLVSHLSLNYLSLVREQPEQAGAAIREMLNLYCEPEDQATRRQIEGIKAVKAETVVRRLPIPGPISFARGLRIDLTCDDSAFEGMGSFLLASVLEEFFARYVSINSFTELNLRSLERGDLMRWPPRLGRRQLA